jgi:orotate phosphoribosyltransferase-like protein
MAKYRLHIVSDCGEKETYTSGETVKECIDKLKDHHTLTEFEKELFAKKGEDRLNKELNSGWYINLKN